MMVRIMTVVLALCITPAFSYAADIHLKIGPTLKPEGTLLLGLYDKPESFPADPESAFKIMEIDVGEAHFVEITLKAVPNGTYAISVYHDQNSNREFDLGLMGIPVERYGFSNNAKGDRGAPAFEDAAFEVGPETLSQTILLN